MAVDQNVNIVTLPANADLSADQYKAVDVNTSGNVAVVASAGGRALGILYNKPSAAGRAASVAISGIAKAIAGSAGVATAGLALQADSDGTLIAASSGDYVVGYSLAAAAAGDVFPVLLLSKHLNA